MLHVSQVCSKGKSLLRGGACVCVCVGGGDSDVRPHIRGVPESLK